MKKTSETTTQPEVREAITVLGVASVETKGGSNPPDESLGLPAGIEISDE